MRFFIQLSYNGSAFSGWQIQDNANSVQAELERALSIRCGETVKVTGAGRTDSGVNARNYIAHFDTEYVIEKEPEAFLYKINAILPPEIVVTNICRTADDAHARFDASARTYNYYLHTAKDPFAVRSLYCPYPLDVEKMNEAAAHIIGRRDFSCFEKVGADNKTSICDVKLCRWEMVDGQHLVFTVTADRFLRNMVRAIVGTLLDIGRGKRPVEWIDEVLASGDRCAAGQSVKGEPLFLSDIRYPYPLDWLA
ncbi:MAG: tRNA pseudouridine(38-40) synthase TruA [Bacteroidales bacterium]|nr:tRNA pseudouridine(38-40) synthase TruA [Bacteroidales bacterium]